MQIIARAVGRRKEAVAQIQIIKGTGLFIINNRPAQDYLQNNSCSLIAIKSPFLLCEQISVTNFKPSLNFLEQRKLIVNDNTTPVLAEKKSVPSLSLPLSNPLPPIPAEQKGGNAEQGAVKAEPIGVLEDANGGVTFGSVATSTGAYSSGQNEAIGSNSLTFSFEQLDTIVTVKGGGLIGQTEAIKLGVARAITNITDSNFRDLLGPEKKVTSVATLSTEGLIKSKVEGPTSPEIESTGKKDTLPSPYFGETKPVLASLPEGRKAEQEKVAQQSKDDSTSPVDSLTALHKMEESNTTKKENSEELNWTFDNSLESLFKKQLKTKGYLTQDSRVKERRKYGLKKARKASQYHKR